MYGNLGFPDEEIQRRLVAMFAGKSGGMALESGGVMITRERYSYRDRKWIFEDAEYVQYCCWTDVN